MRRIWLKIVCLLLTGVASGPLLANDDGKGKGDPIAQKGILDLRSCDFSQKPIALNGEWGFYWEKLLTPADFRHVAVRANATPANPGVSANQGIPTNPGVPDY